MSDISPVAQAPATAAHSASRRRQRRTRQLEEALAEIIRDLPRGTHLTAPEVFRRARERGLAASLSTVYRLLNAMHEEGNVSTVSGEHGRRYEARDSDHDHDHLICLKCGLTIEFTDELIRGFGRAVAERKGYAHRSSRFDVLGICSECKSKDEDHKIAVALEALQSAIESAQQAAAEMHTAVSLLQNRKLARAQEVATAAGACLESAAEQVGSARDRLANQTQ